MKDGGHTPVKDGGQRRHRLTGQQYTRDSYCSAAVHAVTDTCPDTPAITCIHTGVVHPVTHTCLDTPTVICIHTVIVHSVTDTCPDTPTVTCIHTFVVLSVTDTCLDTPTVTCIHSVVVLSVTDTCLDIPTVIYTIDTFTLSMRIMKTVPFIYRTTFSLRIVHIAISKFRGNADHIKKM